MKVNLPFTTSVYELTVFLDAVKNLLDLIVVGTF